MSSSKNPGRGRRDEALIEASRVHVVQASSPQNRHVRRNNLRLARAEAKTFRRLPTTVKITDSSGASRFERASEEQLRALGLTDFGDDSRKGVDVGTVTVTSVDRGEP